MRVLECRLRIGHDSGFVFLYIDRDGSFGRLRDDQKWGRSAFDNEIWNRADSVAFQMSSQMILGESEERYTDRGFAVGYAERGCPRLNSKGMKYAV